MIIKNGQVFNSNGRFIPADVELAGDRIVKVAPAGTLHGDEEPGRRRQICHPRLCGHPHPRRSRFRLLRRHGRQRQIRARPCRSIWGSQGVTSFLGTTMAFSEEILDRIFDTAGPSSARRATARFCGA